MTRAARTRGPRRRTHHPVGQGETGKRVSDLQARLNALGAKLKVDGIFGPKTLAAVKAFQKSHGLRVDGLVGPKTTAALRAKHPAAHHAPAHTPAKTPAKTTPAKTAAGGTAKSPRGMEPDGDERVAGAVTNPKGTAQLHEYWVHGEGAAKIKWGAPGDFNRCVMHLGKFIADPKGYCAQAHHDALGIWPATHAKMEKHMADVDGEERAVTGECIRSVPFELTGDGDGLTLEGYAAVFNRTARIADRHGEFDEQIAPGAFADSLARKTPVLMFEHGKHPLIGSMPLGRIDDIHEDERGLFISARLSDNWLIQPVRDAVKDGAVTGMSFRFASPADGHQRWEKRDGKPDLRTLLRLDAPELGPVVFPAYEPTTASVRSLLERLPEDFTGRDGARSAPGGEEDDVQPGNGGPSPTTSRAVLRDRTWRMRRTLNG